MSNVQKFEELLRSDEALQAKMWELAAAYDGDKADEKAVFEAVLAPLAQEAGLPFTFEEGAQHAAAERGLDDTKLDSVAGGFGGCILFGGNDDPDANGCFTEAHAGANACAYVGISFYGFD